MACPAGGRHIESGRPALRDLRMALASFQLKTTGDGVVMQEMLRSLNELQCPQVSP
jgi:hypothetical protein